MYALRNKVTGNVFYACTDLDRLAMHTARLVKKGNNDFALEFIKPVVAGHNRTRQLVQEAVKAQS